MNRRPYKTTGCFRFFLFFIILAPIAYLVASYVNGEDGIANIKKFLHLDKKEISVNPASDPTNIDNIEILKDQIRAKDVRLEELMKENEKLKKDLEDMEAMLKKMNQTQDPGNQ